MNRYEIGTIFLTIGKKRKDVKTVVDIFKTYNSKNELISIEYISEYEFCGQKITSRDCETTLRRAECNGNMIKKVVV